MVYDGCIHKMVYIIQGRSITSTYILSCSPIVRPLCNNIVLKSVCYANGSNIHNRVYRGKRLLR
jgi:hypothetical protein